MDDEPIVSADALVSMSMYAGAALLLGGYTSLVSTFDGWAQAASMQEQAVIRSEADGELVPLESLTRFSGPVTEDIPLPGDVLFTMHERRRQMRRWIATHPAQDGEERGPVELRVGYMLMRAGPDGVRPLQPLVPAATGRAWPR